MREILFRGKPMPQYEDLPFVKDGWVYGYYIKTIGGNWHYVKDGVDETTLSDAIFVNYENSEGLLINGWVFVDPETVGQYTGITDINEKKIFEKDIVKVELVDGEYFTTGYIREDEASFVVFGKDKGKAMSVSDEYEVIGNLCDNPELSKEV